MLKGKSRKPAKRKTRVQLEEEILAGATVPPETVPEPLPDLVDSIPPPETPNVPEVEPAPPDPAVDEAVGSKLQEAMMNHYQAMASNSRRRPLDWLEKLRLAATARIEAEAADPAFSSRKWLDEDRLTPPGVRTHDAFMTFYRSKGVA